MTTEETSLLDEMKDHLRNFKADVNADLTARFRTHETECTREIRQRTARGPAIGAGPAGIGSGDDRITGTTTSRTPLLADNSEFRAWLAGPKNHRSSFVAEISVPPPTERRAAVPVTGAGGTVYWGGGIAGAPQVPLRLADLIPRIAVPTGAAVSWTRESSFAPAAAIAPEGTRKPESGLTFANIITAFETIANFTKISTQSLSDVPGMMSWLDARLAYACALALENVLLNDATSGLIAAAQPLDPAYTPPAIGSTVLDTIAGAIGQLSSLGFLPDAVVMNAADITAARLLKSSLGTYIWSTPSDLLGTLAMWATPLIASPSLTAGTFLVASLAQSSVLFDREMLKVDISYENEDDFVKNMATVRGELRSALAVPIPSGLVKGALPVGTATAARK